MSAGRASPLELRRFLIEAADSRKISDYDIVGDIG